MPADVVGYLQEAFKRIADSPAWASEYLDRYQQVNGYLGAAEFEKFMDEFYKDNERAFQELESLRAR
jgi:tripartite-type tricarboxylate transporter receptor subunit TctC